MVGWGWTTRTRTREQLWSITTITWFWSLDFTAIENPRLRYASHRLYLTYTVDVLVSIKVATVYGRLRLNAVSQGTSKHYSSTLAKLAVGSRQHVIPVSGLSRRRQQQRTPSSRLEGIRFFCLVSTKLWQPTVLDMVARSALASTRNTSDKTKNR